MAQNLGPNIPHSLYDIFGVQYTENFGRDEQPYLYNGKEFVETHGLNEYDYGFRHYYTATGRFTIVDPLAEQTPWLSPYSYARNNYTNNIDWMGLMGSNCKSGYELLEKEDITKSIWNGLSVFRYTELNSDGTVKKHIDNDDNSVVYNGRKMGTELENEIYIEGLRAYIKVNGGWIAMFYDCDRMIYVTPHMSMDERVRRWLRAKHVDDFEADVLMYAQPIIQNLALLMPILGQYNDIRVIITEENIYKKPADELDKKLAISSLLISGINKIPIEKVKKVLDYLEWGVNGYSCVKSTKEDYEQILEKNP